MIKYDLWYTKNGILTSSRKAKEIQMMRGYRFYIVAAGLILVILSMVTMTVNATESKKLQHENGYYEQIEDEYVQNLRHTLTEKGFRNAGITMTKVFLDTRIAPCVHCIAKLVATAKSAY